MVVCGKEGWQAGGGVGRGADGIVVVDALVALCLSGGLTVCCQTQGVCPKDMEETPTLARGSGLILREEVKGWGVVDNEWGGSARR